MPVAAEDLLEHAAFVRALARSLLFEPQAADDVVQQTWLTALESPPRYARNLRGWLARVVRRHVFRRARAEARRRLHEEASGRGGASPPADDCAARAEVQRRLAEAVTALAEPYRTAVVLRYFDGLKPGAIARRLGVPVETVRTRLKRALATLRERLDAEHGGDRRAWALALVPLALAKPAAAGFLGLALRGGLAMSKRKLLAAAAALALLGVGTLWSIGTFREATPALRSGGTLRPAGSEEGGVEPPAESVTSAGTTYVHHGVVRDEDGRPVAAVRVVVLDLLTSIEREVMTDAEGRFAVSLPHPSDTLLRFRHPEYWMWDVTVAFQYEHPEYGVQKGTPVRVAVIDAQGQPVAGAAATLAIMTPGMVLSDRRADEFEQEVAWAETGPDGIARLAGPEGELVVSAFHRECGFASQRVRVAGPTATTVRLVAANGAIEGRILDADGKPAGDARVLAGNRETRTDAHGRYRLEHVDAGEVEVRAEAGARGVGGYGLDLGWGHDVPVRVPASGTVRDIDITLRPGAWIRGRLVDEADKPIPHIGVRVWSQSSAWFPDATTDAAGGFVLGPCGVWEEVALSVHFDTDRYASYGVREVALPSFDDLELAPGGEIDLGTVRGQRRGTVRGRVIEADGTPARAGGVGARGAHETPVLSDGAFELVHVGPGAVTLHARVWGERPRRSEDREVAVTPGGVVEDIVLRLGEPLVVLRGRVTGKDGTPRAGVRVACVPHDAAPPCSAYADDWSAADGTFALTGLQPGRYRVGLMAHPRPLELIAAREVEVTAAGAHVEFVVEDASARVVGRVVDGRDGSPVESFGAGLLKIEWFVPHHAESAWGHEQFELHAEEAGRYAVEIRADGYAGFRTPSFDVAEGDTKDLGTIRLGPAGALEVIVRDDAGTPVPYAKAYALSSKLEPKISAFTDAEGRARLDDLNPGAYTLFVVSPRHPIGIVRGVAVEAGGAARADVHLPAAAPVTILVRDVAGRAVPGAQLVFTFPALAPLDSSLAERYEPPAFGSNVADERGRIEKPFLPTGEVTLLVTAEGFPPAKRTIDRGPGEATEIEIVLGR